MAWLEKNDELGKCISFPKADLIAWGRLSFWLLYSTNITVPDAIACVY